jgi:1A family penicillin-binding protein
LPLITVNAIINFMHVIKKRLKKTKKLTRIILIFIALLIILAIPFYLFILKDLPLPTKLASSQNPESSQIFDRNGNLLYNIYLSRDQTFVPLTQIPIQAQQATIAIEDKNFYNHGAIDLRGIARALYSIVFHKELQGGSTLTQQLVKTSLLTPERTVTRKIKEIILSFATEFLYSKSKILEMYLNQVPYGGTAYGIEAAAQTYFGKKAKDLDLAESALLAGLPEAPSTFSPFGSHPELASQRQKLVLQAMFEEKYITKAQRDKALKETLAYKRFATSIKAPHFSLFIRDLLIKKYGEQKVEEGGLRVTTTLDLKIQDMAQATVSAEVARLTGYHVSNGAAMVTDPATGEILAMVGSKDYFEAAIDGNVNVTLALRQPGSSIKPINYAVGLINGYSAATPFIDQKVCFPNQGGKNYCPENYDGKFHGVVSMRNALGNSLNIPAVKMLKANGVRAMIATASAMGITTFSNANDYGLSLTLGGGEVSMYDMTQAFGVFANAGYRVNLHPILKIVDRRGKILEEYKPPESPIFGTKVLPEGVAFIISDILADNNARLLEFGPSSELKIKGKIVSAKTGTTNDYRDNWTIGYTPSFVVATWVGNNNNTPMSGLVSGITGAAPIWHGIMATLLENKSSETIQRPSNVIQKAVCSLSGAPSMSKDNPSGCTGGFEYFIKGTENRYANIQTQAVWVDKDTKDLPPPGKTDNLEPKDQQVLTDLTGDRYCLDCPHPSLLSPTPTP